MEEFITFEIAKKLEEKGFPQHWSNDDYIVENEYEDNFEVGSHYDRCFIPEHLPTVAAPTISQVLEWLREEKEIYIIIEPYPTMSTKNKICWSWHFKWNSDGVYMDNIFSDDKSYTTFEEAALTAIKYASDNLI